MCGRDPTYLDGILSRIHISSLRTGHRLIHGDLPEKPGYEVPLEESVEFCHAPVEAGYDAELTVVEGASNSDVLSRSSEAFEIVVQQVLQVSRG